MEYHGLVLIYSMLQTWWQERMKHLIQLATRDPVYALDGLLFPINNKESCICFWLATLSN